MFKKLKVLFLYTESSVHPGAGSSMGVVDREIQRDVHTNLPIIQPSELKGSLREHCEALCPPENPVEAFKIKQVFGPEVGSAGKDPGGSLGFTTARTLLFPLASANGLFAYATCPLCLNSLTRDLAEIDPSLVTASGLNNTPSVPSDKDGRVPQGTSVLVVNGNKVFLSEFPFNASQSASLNPIAKWLSERLPSTPGYDHYKKMLYSEQQPGNGGSITSNLIVLDDAMFRNLLKIRTEIVFRNQLNEKGISVNLWTEENIPADTFMYSVLYATDPPQKNLNGTQGLQNANGVAGYLQSKELSLFILGGNQTVGRGWIRATFL